MLVVLVLVIQHEQFGRARFGADAHVLVLVVVVVEHIFPFVHAVAPVFVERAELVRLVEVHKLHTAEHGVSDQHDKASSVLDHRVLLARRRQGGRRLGLVGGIAGVLPFIHQRGVDGAHEHAQPGDDVFELLVTFFGRHGTRQRAVGVREVAQQGTFGAGDVVSGDVSGEVGGGFHHVAHHGFRR